MLENVIAYKNDTAFSTDVHTKRKCNFEKSHLVT